MDKHKKQSGIDMKKHWKESGRYGPGNEIT